MLRFARRTAAPTAAMLLALAAWFAWPASWPAWTRMLAPIAIVVALWAARRRALYAAGDERRPRGLDAQIRAAAEEWDARHGAADAAEGMPDDEAWRESLGSDWKEDDGDEEGPVESWR